MTASIGGNIFIEHCNPDQMVKEHQVRGLKNSVYFAAKSTNRNEILKLSFHKRFCKRVEVSGIHQINNRIVALQCDI